MLVNVNRDILFPYFAFNDDMRFFILFWTAFLAGSLFPAQSEALFLTLLAQSNNSAILLLVSASIGNVLGSCLNWYLGTQLQRFQQRKWFPFSATQINKAQSFYQRYGYLSLLLSWLPVIGDPLTLIAGVLKERFWRFFLLVSVAKTLRYVALYWVFMQYV